MMKTFLAAGAAVAALAVGANAATLSFYDDAETRDTLRFSVECDFCTAWDGADFAGTDGDLFELNNSSETREIETVNGLTGKDYTQADYSKIEDIDDESNWTFFSSAEYILIKIGRSPNFGVIKNTGTDAKFTFTQEGDGAGLSHYSQFGNNGGGVLPPVPVPAGLPLVLTALGALGLMRLGKRKAA